MILQGRLLADPGQVPRPGWLRVDQGRIAEIGDGKPPEPPAAGAAEAIICPGFVDAHIHLPQIGVTGCDSLDLLAWLDEVVFPAEQRWSDPDLATADVERAYRQMLRAGTLGFAGYLTGHHHGLEAVFGVAQRLALRSIVGQVLMDRNGPDPLLVEAAPLPARPTGSGRLAVSVNPRFAVACSDAALAAGAALAAEGVVIQTHLAESRPECELVAKLFPDDPHYAGVYDRHGLLTDRTLLAHCVHLGEDEWSLIAERRSVVVHCPTANTFLCSGMFNLDAARAHGVRLALGTDVAAGPDLAMPRVARAMIETAKARSMAHGGRGVHIPTPAEAWVLITRGNAEALGFTGMGRLELGAAADLLVLEPDFEIDRHLIGRLIYTWRDEFISARVVNGTMMEESH